MTSPDQQDPSRLTRAARGDRRRGQSMVEFALSFMLFLTIVLGFSQMAIAIWIKTSLHHAAGEGARYGITGQTAGGLGHDASIRARVVEQSAGLIKPLLADSLVKLDYYDASGVPTASNAGGNTLVVTVDEFPVPILGAMPVTLVPSGIKVTVNAVGRMEPIPTPPAR